MNCARVSPSWALFYSTSRGIYYRVNHTCTSRFPLYSVLRGNTGVLLDALALCLCLCLWCPDKRPAVCQPPFTVTGFIKPWMNYSATVSEWWGMTHVSLITAVSLSALSIIQSLLLSDFTGSLFVSPNLPVHDSKTETRSKHIYFSVLPTPELKHFSRGRLSCFHKQPALRLGWI